MNGGASDLAFGPGGARGLHFALDHEARRFQQRNFEERLGNQQAGPENSYRRA